MKTRPNRIKDLSGDRFGLLTVVERVSTGKHYASYICLCDCGTTVTRTHPALKTGGTLSCGCRKKLQNSSHFKVTHGATPRGVITPDKKLYRIWSTMIQRTTNPKAHAFDAYGGAGIKMLPEWESSFEAFRDYIGVAPTSSHSIDRIRSSEGYVPGNIRWATKAEQVHNRKCTVFVEIDGVRKALGAFCADYAMPYKTAYMRYIKYGWTAKEAVSIPSGQKRS